MKLNRKAVTDMQIKPLKVTFTDREILADLQFPAAVDAEATAEARAKDEVAAA